MRLLVFYFQNSCILSGMVLTSRRNLITHLLPSKLCRVVLNHMDHARLTCYSTTKLWFLFLVPCEAPGMCPITVTSYYSLLTLFLAMEHGSLYYCPPLAMEASQHLLHYESSVKSADLSPLLRLDHRCAELASRYRSLPN